MKTKILLFTVLIGIIFTACKKDDDKPAETTPTEQATLFNKKWVQQKWYRDSIDGEMLNTTQTSEFLNDSIMKRTISFPNSTEYQTYSIYDKWRHSPYMDNGIEVKYDSLHFINNNGGLTQSNGTMTYEIKKNTNTELILEWSYLLQYNEYEQFIFKAE